jgi:hypothetical protein
MGEGIGQSCSTNETSRDYEMSSEEELIEWLKITFKNRKELYTKKQGVYRGLYINYPHILDIALPIISMSSTKKEQLIKMAKNGEDRPIGNKTKLGNALCSYNGKTHASYDEEFINKLKQLRPDWFEDRYEKSKRLSFENMMKIMPSFVKFKEGQKWIGIREKYIFICEEYGEFVLYADSLMSRTWKKGFSGHPKMGRDSTGKAARLRIQGKGDGQGRIIKE